MLPRYCRIFEMPENVDHIISKYFQVFSFMQFERNIFLISLKIIQFLSGDSKWLTKIRTTFLTFRFCPQDVMAVHLKHRLETVFLKNGFFYTNLKNVQCYVLVALVGIC